MSEAVFSDEIVIEHPAPPLKRKISKKSRPFLVAEIGLNHNKDVPLAKELIHAAQESGADAVKFQSYTTEKFIYPKAPRMAGLFKTFKKYELNLSEHETLKEFSDSKNILFFSTPLSLDWVDLLEKLDVFGYKIASGDLNNTLLIKKVSSKKKPIFISTGAAKFSDIQSSVNFFKKKYFSDLVVMHCVSLYPTPLEKANLFRMRQIEEEFNVLTGFSDHTTKTTPAEYAVLLGGCVIEKHFTLNKKLAGPDHHLSATPKELASLRKKMDTAFQLRCISQKDSWQEEFAGDYFGKRSLYEVDGEIIPMRPRQEELPRDSEA